MRKYGLIGFPLSHSFSKRFFTEKFQAENKAEVYENFEIKNINLLPEIIDSNPDLMGLNVTIPYKEKVIPYLTSLDPLSGETGAVNTIRIIRKADDTKLIGFNTDIFGFETSLKPLLKDFHHKALILGTGGASKAIKFVLKKIGIQYLSVTTKEPGRNTIGYDQIGKDIMHSYFLIINTTPLGTYPDIDSCPALPYQFITDKHLLYDLVYNPSLTKFLEKGKEKGAIVKNGLDMLEQQAIESYRIWNL